MDIERPLDEAEAQALAETFGVLADPTRLRLIALLLDAERSVGELSKAVGLSVSAVSHQLGMLRRMRIVRARRDGRHVRYTLDDEHVALIYDVTLRHVRHE
jgi:ArsR family transcriptional regulator